MEIAKKSILPPSYKMVLNKHFPLPPARQSSVYPQHPEISSCSQLPVSCTEPDSLGDDQTKSASCGAQVDGRKEEQLETLLAVQPDDMTGKHLDGEHNPLEGAQVSEEEGKVVSKCECLALKLSSACEKMEGPGEPHPVTQPTTAVDGVSHADCTRSPHRGDFFVFKPRLRWTLKQHKPPLAIS